MKLPKSRNRETTARIASRTEGRKRYPLGKALARIRYFETQRGITLTRHEHGEVTTASAKSIPSKRSRARSVSARRSKVTYAAAARGKKKLAPRKFAAAAHLPVWHELGPLSI